MADNRFEVARERLHTLFEEVKFTRGQLVVVSLLAILALAGGLLAARQARTLPVVSETAGAGGKSEAKSADGDKPAKRGAAKPAKKKPVSLMIHVAGDVVRPGLYPIAEGGRVADAVEAAGGPTDGTDLDRLNLAARLADGQKITVGRAAAEESGDLTPEIGLSDSAVRTVNVNVADQTALETLDGIGPVLAKRIIDWREKHGGFKSVSQLNEVSGIGPKKFARLKEQARIY